MDNVERIQDAELKVEQLQNALAAVQTGLERAEQVALAAEEAKARSERSMRIAAALLAVSALAVFVALRRRRR